ncbi:MAG: energy transducer TonB [Bacteroidia bacterium]
MNILKTNHNNLDELVFENRNKAYGAYVLRSDYNNNLKRSFLITFLVPLAIIITSIIYNKLHGDVLPINPMDKPNEKDSVIIIVYELPKKDLLKELEEVMKKPAKAAGINGNYEVKRNVQTNPIPSDSFVRTSDLDLPIGPSGPNLNPMIGGSLASIGAGNGDLFDGNDVQKMPEFPGDLYDFLAKEIKYPKSALENGIQGKVTLSFVIDKNGVVNQIEVLGKVGFGCDEEAIRVIKEMPKWKAGEQNNRKVAVKMVLPIVFEVNN